MANVWSGISLAKGFSGCEEIVSVRLLAVVAAFLKAGKLRQGDIARIQACSRKAALLWDVCLPTGVIQPGAGIHPEVQHPSDCVCDNRIKFGGHSLYFCVLLAAAPLASGAAMVANAQAVGVNRCSACPAGGRMSLSHCGGVIFFQSLIHSQTTAKRGSECLGVMTCSDSPTTTRVV